MRTSLSAFGSSVIAQSAPCVSQCRVTTCLSLAGGIASAGCSGAGTMRSPGTGSPRLGGSCGWLQMPHEVVSRGLCGSRLSPSPTGFFFVGATRIGPAPLWLDCGCLQRPCACWPVLWAITGARFRCRYRFIRRLCLRFPCGFPWATAEANRFSTRRCFSAQDREQYRCPRSHWGHKRTCWWQY